MSKIAALQQVAFAATATLPVGTLLRFCGENGSDQYRRRAHALRVVKRKAGKANAKQYEFHEDDVFETVEPVQFKTGEVLETDYVPSKAERSIILNGDDAPAAVSAENAPSTSEKQGEGASDTTGTTAPAGGDDAPAGTDGDGDGDGAGDQGDAGNGEKDDAKS